MSFAHSEWCKASVRVQGVGGKERGVDAWRPPIMPRGERVCWSIFIILYARQDVPGLFRSRSCHSSPCILIPRRLILLCGRTRLSGLRPLWHLQGSRQGDEIRWWRRRLVCWAVLHNWTRMSSYNSEDLSRIWK